MNTKQGSNSGAKLLLPPGGRDMKQPEPPNPSPPGGNSGLRNPIPANLVLDQCSPQGHRCRDSGYLTDSPASATRVIQFQFGDDDLELSEPLSATSELDEDDENPMGGEDILMIPPSGSGVSSENDQLDGIDESEDEDDDDAFEPPSTQPIAIPSPRLFGASPYSSFWAHGGSPRSYSPFMRNSFSTGSMPVGYPYFRSPSDSPSRSVSTQTPNPHSVLIQQAIHWQESHARHNASLRRRLMARGTAEEHFRHHSDSDDHDSRRNQEGPLPDLVQPMRDRSCSEPSVTSLLERDLGRELQRIGDEFHTSYERLPRTERRRRASVATAGGGNNAGMGHSASFPGSSATRGSWWNLLCQLMASSSQTRPSSTSEAPDELQRQRLQPARATTVSLIDRPREEEVSVGAMYYFWSWFDINRTFEINLSSESRSVDKKEKPDLALWCGLSVLS